MLRLPLSRSVVSHEETYRSSCAGSQRNSIADSDWDYSIGAPSIASPRVVPHGIPPLELPVTTWQQDLPSPGTDWSDTFRASASTPSCHHPTGFMPGILNMSSQLKYCASETSLSGPRTPWPELEEGRWRPNTKPDQQHGCCTSSRSGGGVPAARHLHSNRRGPLNSKESTAGSETASWWSSIMPGTSCQSTASAAGATPGIPSLNCTVAAQFPKERFCDEKVKERARHCSEKIAQRQCRFAQDCEDNINEVLFRDAAEEVEEHHLRPPIDSWDDELRKRPDKLGTLKTWSPQG